MRLLQDCDAGPQIVKKCPHGRRADCCKVYISGLLMFPSACACARTLWFLCQLTHDKLAAGLWRRAPDRQEVSAWQAGRPMQGLYIWTPYVPICMCVCKDSVVPVPAHTRQTCCRTVSQGPGFSLVSLWSSKISSLISITTQTHTHTLSLYLSITPPPPSSRSPPLQFLCFNVNKPSSLPTGRGRSHGTAWAEALRSFYILV
jgi:hypothetical protein